MNLPSLSAEQKPVNEQRDARLLIAEDEANLRLVLQKELQRLGYRVQAAPDGEAALRKLEESNVDVLLCDINMPRMDGMELLRRIHERPNPPEVIMLTGQGTIETAVEAMRIGAYDYLTKPYSINELDVRVRQAAEKRSLRVANQRLRAQIERQSALPEIVSHSLAMNEAIRLVERVAPSETSVLITGESGTGKELIAQAIHRLSNRANGSFIDLNCAAFQESLLESELFGYEAGAFSGAKARKLGLIELADGGTLFLDEVTELPASLQAKLLRAILLSNEGRITSSELPPEVARNANGAAPFMSGFSSVPLSAGHAPVAAGDSGNLTGSSSLRDVEKQQIISALEQTGWHRGKAAQMLGISPSTLYRRLRDYNLEERLR